MSWLTSQKSEKYYKIPGIEASEGSGFYSDLYILTRDLTDEEHAELSGPPTCCWSTVYEKYTSSTDASKFVAYRRVRYTANQVV